MKTRQGTMSGRPEEDSASAFRLHGRWQLCRQKSGFTGLGARDFRLWGLGFLGFFGLGFGVEGLL